MTTTHLPERDRRRRRRVLTRRNVLITIGALLLVFFGISWYFELNPRETGLFDSRVEAGDDLQVTIVDEPIETIEEQYGIDPFSMDAAAREQYLGTRGYDPLNPDAGREERVEDSAATEPESLEGIEPLELESDRDTSRFVIEGGPNGLRVIEKKEEPDEQ